MRRAVVLMGLMVLIGLGLWAALVLPAGAAAELPRTVEEQAESIGDTWAAYLSEEYGEALPAEAIRGPREELVEGVKGLVHERLTMREFSIVERCMLPEMGSYTPSRPPHELELRRDVRMNLYNLDYYLANPRPLLGEAHSMSEDPYLQVSSEVGGQIAELFFLLQRDLVAELAPMIEDREEAGKAIAAGLYVYGYQHVARTQSAPTTSILKRALTVQEMEELRARIPEIVLGECGSLEEGLATSTVLVHSELFGDQLATVQTPREATAEDLRGAAGLAAQTFAAEIHAVYWNEWPEMLSGEEQRTLDEALATRYSGEEPIVSEELTLFDEWFRVWDEGEPAP